MPFLIPTMLEIIFLILVCLQQGLSNPCSGGQTFQCLDGSTPSGHPPCSSGKPQCCSGGQCTDAPPPGNNNNNNNNNNQGQGGNSCTNPSCNSPPCAAGLLGDVGCTTVAGTTQYDHELTSQGDTIASNAHIYGPFEAGFGSQQDSIIESWGCNDPSLVYDSAGGLDIQVAEEKVALACNMEFPRTIGNVYKGIVGECGGHTSDYHFHVRLSCLYSEAGGHSPQLGVVGPYKLYGKWEDYANNLLPLLDACGAHFGPTPDSGGQNVYHYHVQDKPPFTVGCFGPTAGNQLVGVAACRALYSQCDNDGGSGTTLNIKRNGAQQTVTYDRFCPCFDATGSNMGTSIQELPALSTASISYTVGGNPSTSTSSTSSTTTDTPSTTTSSTRATTTTTTLTTDTITSSPSASTTSTTLTSDTSTSSSSSTTDMASTTLTSISAASTSTLEPSTTSAADPSTSISTTPASFTTSTSTTAEIASETSTQGLTASISATSTSSGLMTSTEARTGTSTTTATTTITEGSTTTTAIEIHARIEGFMNIGVLDADSFLNDDDAQSAVKDAIAEELDVPSGYLTLITTKLDRRLSKLASIDRKLSGTSLRINYRVDIPKSAAHTLSTVTSNANAMTKESLQSAVSSKIAAAKGSNYTLTVASSTAPAITLLKTTTSSQQPSQPPSVSKTGTSSSELSVSSRPLAGCLLSFTCMLTIVYQGSLV